MDETPKFEGPKKLTRKQIVIIASIIIVLIIGGCWVARAEDGATPAPCPPGCEPACPPGCTVAKPVVAVKKTPIVAAKKSTGAKERRDHWRKAFGGDLGYDETHKLLAGVHFGLLAPKDSRGGNIFWKIGPTFQSNRDWSAECTIGCRSCTATAQGAGPLGALTGVSYIWP